MNAPDAQGNHIEKAEAELLARYFNISFGHALMYGSSHQMTIDSIKPFYAALKKSLGTVPFITLSLERESVFIEGWCVDKIVNAKKLVTHFKKGSVQSFSFDTTISSEHLAAFLEIAAEPAKYPTADAMKKELTSRGAAGIRINYVVYRKMTADEEIVRKGAVEPSSPAQVRSTADSLAGHAIAFSLAKLLSDPKATADALFSSAGGAPHGHGTVASSIAELAKSVRRREGDIASPDLMEAVLALREECLSRIGGGATAAGTATHEAAAVTEEIKKLTHETILRLIRDEYKAGGVSTKRLAQLLRRMLPDRRELCALLPLLKNALLSEGMPFVKYVELINELRGELEDEGVVSSLAAATREMGVTSEEVLQEIKKNPADAARLIVLASELRRAGGDDSALERMLTEYIEQASSRMAVGSPEAASPENGRQLGAILQKMEASLLDALKRQGFAQSILTALSARLTERLPFLLDITKTEWLKKTIESRPELDAETLASVIAGTVQHSYEIDTHRDTLSRLFEQKGLSPKQIQEVFRQVAALVARMQAHIDLPKGVHSSTAIMFFLERECKLSIRYHNPFSLLIISILGRIDRAPERRQLSAEERGSFLSALLTVLKSALRDIDIIGVPSSSTEAIIFVILPMTSEANTYGLVERLRRELSERTFTAGGAETRLTLAVSITGFDGATMADRTAFLKAAMAHHRAAEKIKLADIKE